MQFREQFDDGQVTRVLGKLRRLTGGNAIDFMREVGAHLKSVVQLRFDRQAGPGGQRWWPSQRAVKQGGQTLRDTSRLRNSITYWAWPRGVQVGTNVVYAPRHHHGFRGVVQVPAHVRIVTQAFGRRLPFGVAATVKAHAAYAFTPRRPFLGFDGADREDILDIAREHIARLVAAAKPPTA